MKETKSYNFPLKLSVASFKLVQTLLFSLLRRYTKSGCPSFFFFTTQDKDVSSINHGTFSKSLKHILGAYSFTILK